MTKEAKETARLAKTLVGLSLDDAKLIAVRANKRLRIMERDGQQIMSTCDARDDRVNVALTRGIISKAWVG